MSSASDQSHKSPSIILNFFMNFLLNVSAFLFPLITFPYASRVLGPDGTGAVAMGTNLVSYFTMVAMLGVPVYGVRACAAVRDNPQKLARTIQELLLLNLLMSIVAYGLFFLSVWIVPTLRTDFTLYTICSAAIILNVIGMNWVYQALEQYSYITGITMLFKLIGVILMFAFVRSRASAGVYGAVTVVSSFGSGVINFIHLRKLVHFTSGGKWDLRQHIKPILRFFAMSVATSIYTSLDVVMLGLMKNNTVVGYYNAAIKIKTILVSLTTSLGTVLLPRLSFYFEHRQMKTFWSLVSRAFSFILLFSIPCCIFFSLFAKDVILVLSGQAFLPATVPMIILMPTILLIGLSNITGIQILVPEKREKVVLNSVMIGAAVDFLINLVLIPFLDSSGAAIGTVCAELAVLVYQYYALRRRLSSVVPGLEWSYLIKALIPALAVGILCAFVINCHPFIRIAVSAVCFFGVYGVILLFCREPILMNVLRRLIPERKSI